jgi:hypothetical protein
MYPVQDVCPDTLGWRGATPDDHRCVPADVQAAVAEENIAASTRTQVATGSHP